MMSDKNLINIEQSNVRKISKIEKYICLFTAVIGFISTILSVYTVNKVVKIRQTFSFNDTNISADVVDTIKVEYFKTDDKNIAEEIYEAQ